MAKDETESSVQDSKKDSKKSAEAPTTPEPSGPKLLPNGNIKIQCMEGDQILSFPHRSLVVHSAQTVEISIEEYNSREYSTRKKYFKEV